MWCLLGGVARTRRERGADPTVWVSNAMRFRRSASRPGASARLLFPTRPLTLQLTPSSAIPCRTAPPPAGSCRGARSTGSAPSHQKLLGGPRDPSRARSACLWLRRCLATLVVLQRLLPPDPGQRAPMIGLHCYWLLPMERVPCVGMVEGGQVPGATVGEILLETEAVTASAALSLPTCPQRRLPGQGLGSYSFQRVYPRSLPHYNPAAVLASSPSPPHRNPL